MWWNPALRERSLATSSGGIQIHIQTIKQKYGAHE